MSATISFDEWGGVDQHRAQLAARDDDRTGKPLLLRVMFAALGWSNLIGHAEFVKEPLEQILASVDKNGEVSIPSRGQVNTAIRRASELGLVSDNSTRFCLITPDWWEKQGGTGGRTCAHHGIGRARKRHTRSAATTGKRHISSAGAAHIECRSDPLTSENLTALYESTLPPSPRTRRSA